MKKLLLTLLAASAAVAASATDLRLDITVKNPLKTPREATPVVVDLSTYAPGMTVVKAVATVDGKEIPTQLDDLDLDGVADELAMTVDVAAKGKTRISLALSDTGSQADYTPSSYAYIKIRDEKKTHIKVASIAFPGTVDTRAMYNSIYGHGAVMEGLHNALRIYMDNRQSVDLYGKNEPRLELEETGFYTTLDQLNSGFGRDILWAGKSVGAGSFRGYQNSQPVTIDTVATRGQALIASGPVRAIVDVIDKGWIYNGRHHAMTQRYTLYGQRHDFSVDVHISGVTADDLFCGGIQKLESDHTGFVNADGLAGSWGSNIPEKKYPELVEWLGLGIYPAKANLVRAVEDEYNYLDILRPDADGRIAYSVNIAAMREKDGFKDAESWFSNLRQWKEELATPCEITVKAAK